MENPDKVRQANAVVNVIRVLGVLFFIASGLGVLPWKYAVFAGIACFLIAPALRQFFVTR